MKSANIFLFKNGQAKVGDLNVSKIARQGLLQTQTGTPYYAAPEVWNEKPYDFKSDVWSFGVVIYEMCALVPPFRADDMAGLFKKVLRGHYAAIPTHFSMDMRQLIKEILKTDPRERPLAEDVWNLPIVQKRIRKYFGNGKEGGKIVDLMTERPQNRGVDTLYETIRLQ